MDSAFTKHPDTPESAWEVCRGLDDAALTERLKALCTVERKALAHLLIHLAEFDDRKLYAPAGFSSLFVYCTGRLGYSEDAAYKRIQAARAAKDYPLLIERLALGRMHLAAIVLLAPHLTDENHLDLIDRACGRSKHEVERLVAEFRPEAAKADCVRWRTLPIPPAAESEKELGLLETNPGDCTGAEAGAEVRAAEAPPTTTGPSSASSASPLCAASADEVLSEAVGSGPFVKPRALARISFDADEEFVTRLKRAREVLTHKHPAGRLADIFRESLEALLEKKDPDRRLRRLRERRSRRRMMQRGNPSVGPSRRLESGGDSSRGSPTP